jgi:hypothetical protein
VAVAVGEAICAVCRGDQPTFGTYLEPLAAEQAPGWAQAVSREIAGFLRSSVTAAWRHGWQPAELARHAGRELGGAHASMAADMIADEMRGYAAATVDDRWAAQVASLDASVWWGSDAGYLDAWQGRQGATVKEAGSHASPRRPAGCPAGCWGVRLSSRAGRRPVPLVDLSCTARTDQPADAAAGTGPGSCPCPGARRRG